MWQYQLQVILERSIGKDWGIAGAEGCDTYTARLAPAGSWRSLLMPTCSLENNHSGINWMDHVFGVWKLTFSNIQPHSSTHWPTRSGTRCCLRMMHMKKSTCFTVKSFSFVQCRQHVCGCRVSLSQSECYGTNTGSMTSRNILGTVKVFVCFMCNS